MPERRRAGALPAPAGRGRGAAAQRLPSPHHPAHRLRAAVHARGGAAGRDLAGRPLHRTADGHRGPAPGDRRAGLGERAHLRPAGVGGRPDQGSDPDPRRAAAALLHPQRAVRQVRPERPRRPGALRRRLSGARRSRRLAAQPSHRRVRPLARRRAPGDYAARYAAHGRRRGWRAGPPSRGAERTRLPDRRGEHTRPGGARPAGGCPPAGARHGRSVGWLKG